MFIDKMFSCRSCGALWPQFGSDPRKVQMFRWVCSPACSQRFLAAVAGLSDVGGPAVPADSYRHRRNKWDRGRDVPLMLGHAGALPPDVLSDYRGEVGRIVEAISRDLDGFRGT